MRHTADPLRRSFRVAFAKQTDGIILSRLSGAGFGACMSYKRTPPRNQGPIIGSTVGSNAEIGAPRAGCEVISFGPFRLFPAARALEKDTIPLALGDRALDLLTVLVEHAGKVVSHRELLARVWRGLVVDPSNLRVHINGLRRALGDRDGRARYIANITGQGYCFVAHIERELTEDSPPVDPGYPCSSARQRLTLPQVLARMVGREQAVKTIATDLIAERFVTIIGPGGMGKTTVAVAVAHAMLEEFADAVCFVDLGVVSEPTLVAATVASSLGLTIQTGDVMPTLMECLKSLRLLLVLDNCEHVVDAVAILAETTFRQTAGVHLLATSREALRVEGEHVYWLPPLASPAPNSSLLAANVRTFPAVRLFMERAAASGARFELDDRSAPIVAGICGRLDGVALAIEFAAGRAGSHGIAETADLLNRNLALDWDGRRTALPRHRTLRALLDWSYGFLTEPDPLLLRRLSVFVGAFSIQAAQAVACMGVLDETSVVRALDSLVAKSLVCAASSAGAGGAHYRLLNTTRTYAAEKLQESGEATAVAERHARYCRRLLTEEFRGAIEPPYSHGVSVSAEQLGNVRAALGWCFADQGASSRLTLGVELAAAAVPLFLELSLLDECNRWCIVALAAMDAAMRGGRCELVLQEARAISSSWTHGTGDDVYVALARALVIARDLGDAPCRLRLLVGMHIFLVRAGDFRESLAIADELQVAAKAGSDAPYQALSDWMRGSSEHFMGDQGAAREHFERGFARIGPRNLQLFGLDYRVRAMVTFARVLWLGGWPDRAMQLAKEAIQEAARASKPLNVCFALLYSVPIFLWCGDFAMASETLEKLIAHPNWQALPSLHATGLAMKGEVALRRGDCERAAALLAEALTSMRGEQQSILAAGAACALAEGLVGQARLDEARNLIGDAIVRALDNGEAPELPELLRIKATILLSSSPPITADAEECLKESLDCARRQSARSWELRTALTLARFRDEERRRDQARDELAAAYGRFTEGFRTADLLAAGEFLRSLGAA